MRNGYSVRGVSKYTEQARHFMFRINANPALQVGEHSVPASIELEQAQEGYK